MLVRAGLVWSGLVWSGLVWVALFSEAAPAQIPGGFKPTVADVSGAVLHDYAGDPNPPPPPGSPAWPYHPAAGPLMNVPHVILNPPGEWNNGEAATAPLMVDQGGTLGWPDAQPQLDVHVHQYELPGTASPEGWTVQTRANVNAQYRRLRGYLRNEPLPAGVVGGIPQPPAVNQVTDAAFEVIMPEERDIALPTVIVLQTPATFFGKVTAAEHGIEPDIGFRFGYAGWLAHSGLLGHETDQTPPVYSSPNAWAGNVALMDENERRRDAGTIQHNVICVRVMPKLVIRPARFQMQRNLEVVRAVQAMLADPASPASPWRPPHASWQSISANELPVTCVIEGGSLGGAVAMWTAILFPSDFHGAVSSGACPSLRAWVGEQESHRYLSTLSGFNQASNQASPNEFLHYASALWGIAEFYGFSQAQRDTWSPFYHASSVRAWKDGLLKRPIYAIVADEDFVAHGTDAIAWLSGQQEFVPAGATAPHPTTGVRYFWSVAGKSCHTGDQREFAPAQPSGTKPFPEPTTGWFPGPYTYTEAILAFLHEAVASRNVAPSIPFTAPTNAAEPSQDVYEHFLQPAAAPPAPPTTPLRLDPTFGGSGAGSLSVTVPAAARRTGKSFGSGAFLGNRDSITTGVYEGVMEVFVGSADGVVTKFAVDAAGEMVPLAMSPSLGFGAWGIAITEADGEPGKEIVVSTHRGLHVLHREDLHVIQSRRDLDWEMTRPRHLRLADVVPGGYKEIVMVSDLGTLAVYKVEDLSEVARYGEAGIVDFQVLGEEEGGVILALLSERGHVIKLLWDFSGLAEFEHTVLAVSPRLNGIPKDLELADVDGTPGDELIVFMGDTVPQHKEAIWILDPGTLTAAAGPAHQIADLSAISVSTEARFGGALDLEVAGNDLVLLAGGQILLVPGPASASTGRTKVVSSFPPMMRPLDIAVADIVDNSPAPSEDEVIVTTESGYVCWFTMSELAASGSSFPFTSSQVRPTTTNGKPMHCNRTTAATWGMVENITPTSRTLELLDQSGSRWSMDSAGNVALLHQVADDPSLLGLGLEPLPGPFRSLRKLEGVLATAAAAEFDVAQVPTSSSPFQAATQIRDIKTAPYVPIDTPTTPAAQFVTFTTPGGLWASSRQFPHHLFVNDEFIPFPMGGDVFDLGGGQFHVCWWGGRAHAPIVGRDWANRVQGLYVGAGPSVTGWWSSGVDLPVAGAGQTVTTIGPVAGNDLRNQAFTQYPINDAQALRLFEDPLAGVSRVAITTAGARLLVLEAGTGVNNDIGGFPKQTDGTTGKVLDFGSGGMALAVADRASPHTDIYLGAMQHFPADNQFQNPQGGADDITSALVWVEYEGNASFNSTSLRVRDVLRLDGDPGGAPPDPRRPKVYGVCGMAVGNLIQGNGKDELVVGALDGHLLVYERDRTTGAIGNLLYNAQVEGAVGAYNAIVIADLDNDGQAELYVAGSLGLRKWIP